MSSVGKVQGLSGAASSGDAPEFVQCTLCGGLEVRVRLHDERGVYLYCPTCDLIFLHPEFHPSPEKEAARYLQHNNSPDDPGYRAFLGKLVDHMIPRLGLGGTGLDFGCGPSAVMAELMAEAGIRIESYDPHFFPDEKLLATRYDFITCSEVAEHFRDPAASFHQLSGLLRPGGVLGVMTAFHDDADPFESWWYRRDLAHVAFYSRLTMRWIASAKGWKLELPESGVALFVAPGER